VKVLEASPISAEKSATTSSQKCWNFHHFQSAGFFKCYCSTWKCYPLSSTVKCCLSAVCST